MALVAVDTLARFGRKRQWWNYPGVGLAAADVVSFVLFFFGFFCAANVGSSSSPCDMVAQDCLAKICRDMSGHRLLKAIATYRSHAMPWVIKAGPRRMLAEIEFCYPLASERTGAAGQGGFLSAGVLCWRT